MMRWTRKRMSRLLLQVFACFMIVSWLAPVMEVFAAGEQRVYDEAGLVRGNELLRLEAEISGLIDEMNMDVVLVTTNDTSGKDAENFADDFYDQGGFGMGSDRSGVLLLLDMDNREVYISTSGAMIRFLTDSRIDTMLDHAISYMKNGDYYGAAVSMLDDTRTYYKKGIPGGQYNYDRETGRISRYYSIRWYEVLIALAVSLFCGAAACLNVKREYAMKREQKLSANYHMAYRTDARFRFDAQQDLMFDSSVARSFIPRSSNSSGGSGRSGSGSTTHRSSSGGTHGGGGRKF